MESREITRSGLLCDNIGDFQKGEKVEVQWREKIEKKKVYDKNRNPKTYTKTIIKDCYNYRINDTEVKGFVIDGDNRIFNHPHKRKEVN